MATLNIDSAVQATDDVMKGIENSSLIWPVLGAGFAGIYLAIAYQDQIGSIRRMNTEMGIAVLGGVAGATGVMSQVIGSQKFAQLDRKVTAGEVIVPTALGVGIMMLILWTFLPPRNTDWLPSR